MKTLLFQGDSITDASRRRDLDIAMGCGYATMTAGRLAVDFPNAFRFLNRGVSGEHVQHVRARIQEDIIQLKPDIMTLMIGVNNVWQSVLDNAEFSAGEVASQVEELILEVQRALPDIQIVLLQPFVLSGTATKSRIELFRERVGALSEAYLILAEGLKIPYVTFQAELDAMAEVISFEDLAPDGVHPTCCGHEIISRKLYEVLKAMI